MARPTGWSPSICATSPWPLAISVSACCGRVMRVRRYKDEMRKSNVALRLQVSLLDEIDKIAGREGGHGPDVSREGVQRDILPIVEGTTVNTRYGMVRTDHI